ncbi:hypothetical protein [Frondihabitans australicus]|uniref:Uncharacterized protein n=1 Tax=Frondihabitans australicus TaxID=386892 RepID=A0A495IBE1_9MICO|nr:hypothetical protein [Frondihabitans australicus]RKR73317.1 hypothetical protein C8E83_0409 [Frondihabitans australicus]
MTSVAIDRRVRIARVVLVLVGVLVIALGAYTMVTTLKPNRIWGLVTWLIAAVILHDAILSPFVVVVGVLLRRAGRSVHAVALVVAQIAIVVAAVLLSTVLPEIDAKHHVQRNPTVVPFDYVARLAVVEAVLVVIVVAALVVGSRRRTHRVAADAVTD